MICSQSKRAWLTFPIYALVIALMALQNTAADDSAKMTVTKPAAEGKETVRPAKVGIIEIDVELLAIPEENAIEIASSGGFSYCNNVLSLLDSPTIRFLAGGGRARMAGRRQGTDYIFRPEVLAVRIEREIKFSDVTVPISLASAKLTLGDGRDGRVAVPKDLLPKIKEGKIRIKATYIPKGIELDMSLSSDVKDAKAILKGKVKVMNGKTLLLIGLGDKNRNLILKVTPREVRRIAQKNVEARRELEEKLKSLVLDIVPLDGTPIMQAVEFLKHLSRRADFTGEGVNVIVKLPKNGKKAAVHIEGRNLTVYDVLKKACDQNGLTFDNDGTTVLIGDFEKQILDRRDKGELERHLDSLLVEKVVFVDNKLSDVVKFLKLECDKLDPTGKGVKMMIVNPKKKPMPVLSMDVEKVPISKLLLYSCGLTDSRIEFKDHEVVITIP